MAALLAMGGGGACTGSRATTCTVNGVSHHVDELFSNGCNECSCSATGEVRCTLLSCRDGGPDLNDASAPLDQNGDAAATCDFSASYEYGAIGGLVAFTDRSYLSPGNQYRHTRTPLRADASTIISCMPALPACGALDLITAYDIEVHDLPLADVRNALAQTTPPLYGFDQRPADGTVFELQRSDGRGFLVGAPCPSTNVPSCTPIPTGIAQLRKRLLDLDTQQLASPDCQALRAP